MTSTSSLERIYSLKGRTALVTGGGTGLGKAIATCLAQAGAKVIIAGRRAEVLETACKDIGHGCCSLPLDLEKTDTIAAFAKTLATRFGPVDILVNNAGNTVKRPFEESSLEDFDSVFDVHVRGALELTRAIIKQMLVEGREGSILFTSSMTAYIGQPMVSGYTISKTAINGVVRALSAEFAGRGIRVNGVAPGWIDTELYRAATKGDAARQTKILSRIPMGKLGDPEDIGWSCAFLASAAAKYVTGQVILVDGGGATGF
ncbi:MULTISPECIES: SDR family NAD(P)-dependent oxidoreductase [Falsihalocynthiibacter]|uniref:SDR family NAD(P)-dependent oxidoreductase n=1 Tax=Falsihalocynthiibacter TaxID=2854182 RepID=UPI0030011A84